MKLTDDQKEMIIRIHNEPSDYFRQKIEFFNLIYQMSIDSELCNDVKNFSKEKFDT